MAFYLETHILQGQSLHSGTLFSLHDQRDQRRLGRQDRVSQFAGHFIAVSGGAGQWVGAASGGENRGVTAISAVLRLYAPNPALLN